MAVRFDFSGPQICCRTARVAHDGSFKNLLSFGPLTRPTQPAHEPYTGQTYRLYNLHSIRKYTRQAVLVSRPVEYHSPRQNLGVGKRECLAPK